MSCPSEAYVAPTGAKLELIARQANSVVELGLHNAGTEPICVHTHIATHEWQNDWVTIEYADGGKYHHVSRALSFDDDRDRSAPVSVLLGAAETHWQRFDAGAGAARARNGSQPLTSGLGYAHAIYDTTAETTVWSGRLRTLIEPVQTLGDLSESLDR